MSVKAPKLPPARTVLGAVDSAASASVAEARNAIKPVVLAEVPRKRGVTQQALQPRRGKTKTGYTLTVAPPRGKRHDAYATVAQVVRWVNRGTGLRREGAGAKNRIRPKGALNRLRGAALNVYGRPYRSVRGQAPNPFMARIARRGGDTFDRIVGGRGPKRAADTVDRVLS